MKTITTSYSSLCVVLLFCVYLRCCNGYALDCPLVPVHTPANVTDLHPNNIKVVMALGDSITAAFGVHGASGGLVEARGQSWSIGMDPGAITAANFIKYFNPNVTGGSVGSHLTELCYGPLCPPFQYKPKEDLLNSAQSGAMISDLVTHEVDYLVRQVKDHKGINIKQDWKLLTILIGANDLCAACTFAEHFLDPDEFEKHLTNTLNNVRKELPRTLVQIAEMFNLSQVYDLSLKSSVCKDIHRAVFIECDCVFAPGASKTRQEIDEYAQLYNERSRKVAAYFQSLNDPQFTVVTQPFGRDTSLATFPIDALSTLDCFHPSLSTHQAMAINLWNNMLTPSSKKLTKIDLNATPMCPTANSRIYVN